jgi:thermostable 8-oxoguanine DNA glycosylase
MVSIELPPETEEVVPGVKWGMAFAFPSPAYWKYQVLARRIQGNQIRYQLGKTLPEEIGACLLGGHGISAAIGIAAFEHLKQRGVFEDKAPDDASLYAWLSEPIQYGNKTVRYRFAKQKAKYLSAALAKLNRELAPNDTGKALRNWLLDIPGIGYKTASWIARNWLDADDVAILDIHLLRAGQLGGFFAPKLTVERHYLELEEQFIAFSRGLGVRPSELDAIIWHEMMSSPYTVRHTLKNLEATKEITTSNTRPRTKQHHPDAYEGAPFN